MLLNELLKTLKTLSKTDLKTIKDFLESLELDFNDSRIFFYLRKQKTVFLVHIVIRFISRKMVIKDLFKDFYVKIVTSLLQLEIILSHFHLKSHSQFGKNTLNV